MTHTKYVSIYFDFHIFCLCFASWVIGLHTAQHVRYTHLSVQIGLVCFYNVCVCVCVELNSPPEKGTGHSQIIIGFLLLLPCLRFMGGYTLLCVVCLSTVEKERSLSYQDVSHCCNATSPCLIPLSLYI